MEHWEGLEDVRLVETREDFRQLRELLLETERPPVVILSIAEGATAPAVDARGVDRELGDSVAAFVLTPEATFWLTDLLGGKALSVHSGWARVYPADPAWRDDPRLAPSFSPTPSHAGRAVARVVEAAFAAAFRDGGSGRPVERPKGRRCTVTVRAIASSTQAIVVDPSGYSAVLRSHHLVKGLPAARVLAPGQQFKGVLQSMGMIGEFVPELGPDDAFRRALEFVGAGITTTALASVVSPEVVELLLHPEVPLVIEGERGEDLTKEVTPNEAVVVEVVPVEGRLVAAFSDDEPEPAMSVLPGGPPWLASEARRDRKQSEPCGASEDKRVVGADSTASDWEAFEQLQQQVVEAQATISGLRRELRRRRRLSVPVVYRDPEEQFRFEARLAYLTGIDEDLRDRFPWQEGFAVGPDFLASIEALVGNGGISRDKVVQVCAEVVCGLAKELPTRALKPWLTTKGGLPLERPHDGAVAMRVRLQTGTSAARRLKYWKLPTGMIELDSVDVHDAKLRQPH